MALASKVGTYSGGSEAIGPDIEAWVQSVQDRINAITLEQMGSDTVGTAQLIDLNITLAKIAAAIFTADSTGRGKFANAFVNRALQDNVAKGAGAYVRFTETASSGVNAVGNPTTVKWTVRSINTLNEDTESIGAVLVSGGPQFSLPAGTYYADISATTSLQTARAKLRLRDVTGSVTSLRSLSIGSAAANVDVCIRMSGIFTLSVPSTMEIQHWVSSPGGSSTDFGRAAASGEAEDFVIADFWKVGPDPT